MNKDELISLRDQAEQRCVQDVNQLEQVKSSLERNRGDFRTYDFLIGEMEKTETEESNKKKLAKSKE